MASIAPSKWANRLAGRAFNLAVLGLLAAALLLGRGGRGSRHHHRP